MSGKDKLGKSLKQGISGNQSVCKRFANSQKWSNIFKKVIVS